MSMMSSLRQVSPGVIERLRADPERVEDALDFGEERAVPSGMPGKDVFEQVLASFPAAHREMLRAGLEKTFRPRGPNALAEAGVTAEELPEPLQLDKAWLGLHYLLCGDVGPTDSVRGKAILGGEPLGEDLGYGPALVVEPEEVEAIAAALERLTEAELEKRFAPAEMDEVGVYPHGWTQSGRAELDWLLDAFRKLRAYYLEARDRGFGMLMALR